MNRTHDNTLTNAPSNTLERLDRMDDFKVADGDPDVRGWDVQAIDGRVVGQVDDLIVDTRTMGVRFLAVNLDRGIFKEDRAVLIPLANARLDDNDNVVRLPALGIEHLGRMDAYDANDAIVVGSLTSEADSRRDNTDNEAKDFYGKRGSGKIERMTLSEEQMQIGKRSVSAGEATIAKTVETEHVRQTVPVNREEVVLHKRDITAQSATRNGEVEITDDEIRIPLMSEEAVIEKRVVPTEEVVITKRIVQEDQVVEADLKREKLDTKRTTADTRVTHED